MIVVCLRMLSCRLSRASDFASSVVTLEVSLAKLSVREGNSILDCSVMLRSSNNVSVSSGSGSACLGLMLVALGLRESI